MTKKDKKLIASINTKLDEESGLYKWLNDDERDFLYTWYQHWDSHMNGNNIISEIYEYWNENKGGSQTQFEVYLIKSLLFKFAEDYNYEKYKCGDCDIGSNYYGDE
jgi:hypothetical protein